jgi:hypothetical protein
MKFTLENKMDNAAFDLDEGGLPSEELSMLLRRCANDARWAVAGDSGNLRDHNGNTCGSWKVVGK